MSVKRSFDVSDVGTRPTLTSMPLAISSGLDWPFGSRQRLEKKRAAFSPSEKSPFRKAAQWLLDPLGVIAVSGVKHGELPDCAVDEKRLFPIGVADRHYVYLGRKRHITGQAIWRTPENRLRPNDDHRVFFEHIS